MVRYYTIPRQWAPLSIRNEQRKAEIERELEDLFYKWEGTPYMSGNQCIKLGVDCVRFVTAFLDSLHKIKTSITTLPSDASFHNKRAAMKTMLTIKKLYAPCKTLPEDSAIEPGDVIIIGPPGGGPAHAMIAGTEPNTIWHCTTDIGVVKTGWALAAGQQQIYRVYRIRNRAKLWS